MEEAAVCRIPETEGKREGKLQWKALTREGCAENKTDDGEHEDKAGPPANRLDVVEVYLQHRQFAGSCRSSNT